MANRRGKGEGSLRKRSDGRWQGSFLNPLDAGDRRYVYGQTRNEALAKMRDLRRKLEAGEPETNDKVTLAAFLETWLEDVVKPSRSHSTWQGYSINVRAHILPALGNRRLVALTASDVQRLINAKRKEGLASRTVQYIHATLRAALSVAMRWGIVSRNVATLVEPVRLVQDEVEPFTLDEIAKLIVVIRRDVDEAFWMVGMSLGLRPSETLALRWDDIDFDQRLVRVRRALERRDGGWSFKEPKSRSSRRTVPLPWVCADALERHRDAQVEFFRSIDIANEHDLVFTRPNGDPRDRTQMARRFRELQERAGVRHHRLYDLRHTAASLLLMQGVAPRVVMETLGHSSYALTMNTYTHVMPVLMREAASAMDRALGDPSAAIPALEAKNPTGGEDEPAADERSSA